MNQTQMTSLVNISALLILIPILLVVGFVLYIFLNSPMGSPFFRWLAEAQFKKKQFEKAAHNYAKLHHMQELVEGPVYARKAGLSHELNGNLREAVRWYERAEDWAKMGQLLMESGDYSRAAEIFETHALPARLAHCYETQEKWLAAGEIYEMQVQNLHRAEQLYRKAASQDDLETRIQAQLVLARIYAQLGRHSEAVGIFREAEHTLNSSPQFQEFPDLLKLKVDIGQRIEKA